MYYYLEAKYKEKRIFILQKYIQYYRTRKKAINITFKKKSERVIECMFLFYALLLFPFIIPFEICKFLTLFSLFSVRTS